MKPMRGMSTSQDQLDPLEICLFYILALYVIYYFIFLVQGTRGKILKSKSHRSFKVSVVKEPFVIVL